MTVGTGQIYYIASYLNAVGWGRNLDTSAIALGRLSRSVYIVCIMCLCGMNAETKGDVCCEARAPMLVGNCLIFILVQGQICGNARRTP
jgi:hypothetical protein